MQKYADNSRLVNNEDHNNYMTTIIRHMQVIGVQGRSQGGLTKVSLDDSASSSDEALFNDATFVTSSSEQLMMMSSHCVHLSSLQCHLVTLYPIMY